MKRRTFEQLIDAAAHAGLVKTHNDQFVNSTGKLIKFRRVGLTEDGRTARAPASLLRMPGEPAGLPDSRRRKRSGAGRSTRSARRPGGRAKPRQLGLGEKPSRGSGDEVLEAALRAFRKSEARRRGVPAFVVFNNRCISGLVASRPRDRRELLQVPGIGNAIVKNYGAKILEVLRTAGR